MSHQETLVLGVATFWVVFAYVVYRVYPWKKNTALTSKATIMNQMNEPRPLPMGQAEFMEWSDRIISGAQIPTTHPESIRKVLAAMIMQLGQTESHKPDAFFIHALRKAAANEVAHSNFQRIQAEQKEELKVRQASEVVADPGTPAA